VTGQDLAKVLIRNKTLGLESASKRVSRVRRRNSSLLDLVSGPINGEVSYG